MKAVRELRGIVAISIGMVVWLWVILRISDAAGSKKDFWDILTAIGTCAAAIIALFFGIGQLLATRNVAKIQARLIAARLLPKLTASQEAMISLVSLLNEYDADEKNVHVRNGWFIRCGKAAHAAKLNVPLIELTGLAPLPNDCAMHVARASAVIDTIIYNFDSFDSGYWTVGAPEEVREKFISSVLKRTKENMEVVADAFDICLNAYNEGSDIADSAARSIASFNDANGGTHKNVS
ncbi:hypothetical protein [Paraburkholderia caribensis]|uniref:hypothetical protein n=1 Tax=Paraburkholderia caribensis TaxID=75105 RepID=UPI0028649242|nr:hypothetical protein [Paraburkholderia caribensis]MDR6384953.1 hypothetical protein [Paraburkholderia caribensis]